MVNGCYCCLQAEETCNHLLLWCLFVYSLWCLIYGLMESDWVVAGSAGGEIWAWDGIYVKNRLLTLTVLWVIWKERNGRAFDSGENSINRLKNKWIQYFSSILFGHYVISDVNFRYVIDMLT